jgi:hypothetical protein
MEGGNLNIKRCKKCVTPASYPGALLDSEDICFYCREHEKIYGNWEKEKAQRSQLFEKIVDKAKRKKRQYDVMVPLSGGKDSTYALYLATKVYKMKTLAYTFENGFFTDAARENVNRAIEVSGADHYFFKINPGRMMKVYKHFFEHTGLFCPVCMRGMALGRIVLHRYYKIPLILRGTSKRTEEWVTPEIFQDGRLYFFQNVLRKAPLDCELKDFYLDRSLLEKIYLALYILSRQRISIGVMDIQVPDYLEWDYDEIYKVIKGEFGWQELSDRDEHIDCEIEPVIPYIRTKKVPDLTANALRYSAMIRTGMMKRDEALDLVNKEMVQKDILPNETKCLLSKLHITMDEFEEWSTSSFRHMEFQKMPFSMKVFDFVRKFISRDSARG